MSRPLKLKVTGAVYCSAFELPDYGFIGHVCGGAPQTFLPWPAVEEPSLFPLRSHRELRRDAHWVTLARAHDAVLHVHMLLVSELCAGFSAFLDQPVGEQRALARSGLLHDIGKIKVPSTILKKPSPLIGEELATVQAHAQLGYEMLLEAGETEETLLTATRDHHERLDGSGYPRKLTAEQISIPVRMVTLCDVFAAMTEPRPYAATMRWEEALERMAAKRTRLDVELLSAFGAMVKAIHVPKKRFSLFGNRTRRPS